MTIDLTTIANTLLSILAAVASVAIPIVVQAILKHYGVANNAALAGKLTDAADAAAGEAYAYALSHEGGLANVAVHNDALATGTKYVVDRFPDAMKALGLTPDNVQAMVKARLGTLLAGDPTVSAGAPGQAVVAAAGPVVAAPAAPAHPAP